MNGAWQVALPATPSPLRRIEQHHNTLLQTKEIVLLPSTSASRKKAQTWNTDANQQHTNYSEECHQTIEVSQHQPRSPFVQDVTHRAWTRRPCQTQTRPQQTSSITAFAKNTDRNIPRNVSGQALGAQRLVNSRFFSLKIAFNADTRHCHARRQRALKIYRSGHQENCQPLKKRQRCSSGSSQNAVAQMSAAPRRPSSQ